MQAASSAWQAHTQRVAQNIRRRVLDYVIRNNGGYLSQACSGAEILATLYTRIMNLGPSRAPMIPAPFPGVPSAHNPNFFNGALYNGAPEPHRDRFFFSPAHYALVLYATLIEVGRMSPEGLELFNQDGSTVEMIGAEHSPGIETTTGSLGQCLSQAGGVALARKLKGETGRVWVMLSDGEFQEGQTWEAFAALAFHKLDNVGVYVDVNGFQCDGKMDTVMQIEPLHARLESFGAAVYEAEGHDMEQLAALATLAHASKPLVVLARTDPAHGIEILRARAPKYHYVRFQDETERAQYRDWLEEMNVIDTS
ncbi:MAG: transketolase [Chloroflexi bacterium]|nr:transketolase [Chloroflexota bacterium]